MGECGVGVFVDFVFGFFCCCFFGFVCAVLGYGA